MSISLVAHPTLFGNHRRRSGIFPASVSVLALIAGLIGAPAVGVIDATTASAETVTTFPTPDHFIDPSYQDLTGLHTYATEPTFTFSSWDEEQPESGYLDYVVDLMISSTETAPPLIVESLTTVRDSGSSDATWKAPAGLLAFDETYVFRYRLTAGVQQAAWTAWLPFAVTPPGVAPTQLEPTAGALTNGSVQLIAQVPNYVATQGPYYDAVIFTVQEAWQNGEPLTVSQQYGEIGPDGIARTWFSANAAEGMYRWNVQWVGNGYSEPSEFRELTISKVAPPVQYVYTTSVRSTTTVHWQISTLAYAPVQFVDVTLSPGDITRRVPITSGSTTFTELALGDYTASVTATNALGTSAAVTKNFTVVPTSPTSPTNLNAVVTGGRTGAHLTWEPPINDGGSPVDEYFVIVNSYDGGGYQSFYTADLFADITVRAGFTYVIYVYAGNDIGLGDIAATRLEVFGVPSEPRNVVVNPGDGFINVYWDTPENIGGKWPTKYRVTVQGVGTYSVTSIFGRNGIQINDLQNDRSYVVSVRAVNEIGPGAIARVTNVMPISSAADADADDLPDVVEARFGTSSMLADTDNDGITDLDESLKLSAFLSPTIADTDGDGVIDAGEDSDEDGIPNAIEIAGGSNPSSPDSDHDSLTDLAEVSAGSSPILADSDGDGVGDASEFATGLNPMMADSNADGTADSDTIATQTIADLAQYAPATTQFFEPKVDLASELSGVTATISGPAGRLADIVVSSSPSDQLVGALTSVASVMDIPRDPFADNLQGPALASPVASTSTTGTEPSVSQLTFSYAANVSTDRLQDLAPVKWNPTTYSWEFVDNDVSLSTSAHTISIFSPELGLRYAVVDLRTWRAHISECDNGSTGRPQLDVDFVIDEMPSVVVGDTTNERFTAALAVLDSLEPGDTATVRQFGLIGTVTSGAGSAPGFWNFTDDLGTELLSDEESFGLDSLEHTRVSLTALSEAGNSGDLSMFPSGDVGWEPERVLHGSAAEPSAVNPYVPSAAPMECRKKIVVLITDGETAGDLYARPWSEDPRSAELFSDQEVPVHVLDLGIGSPGSSEMLAAIADGTDGTYSYIPTATDLASWIANVTPLDWTSSNPTRDTDRDTIPDVVETFGISGTMDGSGERFFSNPRKVDSDSDGIPDNLEVGQRLISGTKGASWSSATINRTYWIISDPGSKDGDSDGLDDRAEIDATMNPLLGDGDGDGLNDGTEELNGTFAQLYDTDSDGFSDAYEVLHENEGYDPREFNDRMSEYEWLSEAAVGFFCGEVDICSMTTIPWLVGNIASGLLVFGDLRDSIALIVKGDFVSAAFCLVGLIPGVGDIAGTTAKIVKFVRKILSPFGLRTVSTASAAGAGNAANASISGAQAIKLLAFYTGTPKKFVVELVKLEPIMVNSLRTTSKLSDAGITKLITKNGIYRIKAYTTLDPKFVKFYTYTAATLPKVLANGKAGETALYKLVPELANYKQVRDVVQVKDLDGNLISKIRYWDGKYLLGEATHYFEAKVGYSASGFATSQVTKDIARKLADDTSVFEWHFYASSLTGKIGPSLPLLKSLTDAGITVVFHFPGGAL